MDEGKKLKVRGDDRMKINGFISHKTNCFSCMRIDGVVEGVKLVLSD